MEPDSPCLADEVAEPRPDMNIKVAAFTEIEKSIYTKIGRLTPVYLFTVVIAEILLAWMVELQENCVQFHGLVMSYPCQGLLGNN